MIPPTYSIITVSLNDFHDLKQTYDSILAQTEKSIEWIVIDGKSTDQTAEFLDSIRSREIVSQIISEPDNGIFDAMNKGILLAKGKYCLFLNCGDTLNEPNTLQNLNDYLVSDIVVCDMRVVSFKNEQKSNERTWEGRSLGRSFFFNRTLPHQSTLIKRELFDKYGAHDITFKLKGDHDFFARVCLKPEVTVATAPLCISTYYLDGVSAIMKNSKLFKWELERVRKNNFSRIYRFLRAVLSVIKFPFHIYSKG